MNENANTKLRVLQIIPRLNGGGAEATTFEITQTLCAAGGQAIIATQGGVLEKKIEAVGGKIIHLPVASKNPFTLYQNINRLRQLCIETRANIIHARSRAPAWSAYYAAKQLNVPFLTTYHSKVPAKPAWKVFYNSIMTRGQCVIANSQFTAARIATIHKIPPERIKIIPRGCDPAYFDPSKQDMQAVAHLRAKWGIRSNERVILCPARLTRWKGQTLLLDALHKIKDKIDNECAFRLVFVGSAQGRKAYQQALEDQAARLNLARHIVFAGHIEIMPQAYKLADLVVLPSIEAEPFGRTAIEAQAAHIPVIVSDEGGFCETVRQKGEPYGATGWRVPPRNSDALAETLAKALTMDKTELETMGANGNHFITEHYSLATMCDKTLQIYRDMILEQNNA
ncbi:MAG: glycosyltransferase family 4 protein [Alphaproteobacteria bacterium]|nr:glycosyltransferase family 4 protein [Alphaproteobacteria bacterium]